MPPAIDHVVVNVHDQLDAARDIWRRLGFTLTDRGHHTLGSSNHLAMFGTDYLELLGYEPGRGPLRPELVAQPAGLGGLVFKPPPEHDAPPGLLANAVPATTRDFARPVAVPEGTRDARFRTVTVDDPAASYGRLYFCRHYTPELVWRPEWQTHANAVTAVAEVVIATPDPAHTAQLYARLFGAGAIGPTDGGMALRCQHGAAVLLLDPEAAAGRTLGTLPAGDPARPRMVALGLRTASLDAVRGVLMRAGVPITEAPGRVAVPASHASGVGLTFVG